MADTMERLKLIESLPPFMQRFAEMQEIMKGGDLELDRIESSVQKVLDSAFISDCDENGLKRYENLLGIAPDTEDGLELRRARVLTQWNAMLPYTYRALFKKLNAMYGEGNYTVSGNLSKYELHICTHKDTSYQAKELIELLDSIVPINMNIALKNEMQCKVSCHVYVVGVVAAVHRTGRTINCC